MPKSYDTRVQRATRLLRLISEGPSFRTFTPSDASTSVSAQYKLWADTWVLPLVKALVPELRKPKTPSG